MDKKVNIEKDLSFTRQRSYKRFTKEQNPCFCVSGRFDVTNLIKQKKKGHSFNALLCYCVLLAGEKVNEFHYQIKEDGLYYFDHCKINVIVNSDNGSLYWGDVGYYDNFEDFEKEYFRVCKYCKENNNHYFIDNGSLIATSAMIGFPFTSITCTKSDSFWDNFVMWGQFEKKLFKTHLNISLRFHHALVDGQQAAQYFATLQDEIKNLKTKNAR